MNDRTIMEKKAKVLGRVIGQTLNGTQDEIAGISTGFALVLFDLTEDAPPGSLVCVAGAERDATIKALREAIERLEAEPKIITEGVA